MTFSGSKPEISLKGLKMRNTNRIVFGQIDIKSLQNKFEQFHEFCKGNLDIPLITKTKLDSYFSSAQFHNPGYFVALTALIVTLIEWSFIVYQRKYTFKTFSNRF